MLNYILITPAHNEEAFIEKTILSVLAQGVRPIRWVIVNDSSIDGTARVISRFASENSFIELVNLERTPGRDFGKKVDAFNAGFERVKEMECDFIGNLDADISLKPDYYESILLRFADESRLGIAGGMVHSLVDGRFLSQEVSLDSVDGAVQLFRRECFNQIGGYIALPNGGIDAAAEIMARMAGWTVRTFPDIIALEHRRTGSANARPLAAKVKEGQRFYSLGYSALFMFARCMYRLMQPPRVLGSAAAFLGYVRSQIYGEPLVLRPDIVKFLREEQRMKLKHVLRRTMVK